jgi:hypothetical protein
VCVFTITIINQIYKFDIFIKTKIKIMVKIYPTSIHKKDDETYYLMKTVVFTMYFCVCTCVGLIIVLTYVIEDDGSY